MSRADTTNTRSIDTAEYRRTAYRMFRKEGVRGRDARLYRLTALQAWRLACVFPSLARRYAEAVQ